MKNELIIYDQKPLTAEEIRAQVNLIQEVMKGVMKDGTHYGKIPGCGDKPTLLKPGAEKLIATFNLCPEVEVIDLSNDDIIRYRIVCHLKTMSGKFVGDGVGECSSEEDKYKWRKIVSEEEWNARPEDEKRIKFYEKYTQKQVKTNSPDLANTILKMAKKRALIDATLTRTAASDIFTQDIEDMPEEILDKKKDNVEPEPFDQNEVNAIYESIHSRMVEFEKNWNRLEFQKYWAKSLPQVSKLPGEMKRVLVDYKVDLLRRLK